MSAASRRRVQVAAGEGPLEGRAEPGRGGQNGVGMLRNGS